MLVWILAVFVVVSTVAGGGYLLWKKIPQRYLLHKGAMASALRVAHEGHDLVAQIEWADNQVTFMGADFKPGDEQLVLDNGLPIEVVGNGADPVYLGGVPLIKIRAEHASPVDTDAAIAMGREEDSDYELVYENGEVVHRDDVDEVDGSVSMDDSPGGEVDNPEETLETDGGTTTPSGKPVDRKYETSPKGAAEGTAFSLRDATNRAPFSLNPGTLKKAYDIGKREGQNSSAIKMLLMGMGVLLGIILFLAIIAIAAYKILGLGGGGGGGGGGGETINSLLLVGAAATPAVRDRVKEAAQRTLRRYSWQRVTYHVGGIFAVMLTVAGAAAVVTTQSAIANQVLLSELENSTQVATWHSLLTFGGLVGVYLYLVVRSIRLDGQPAVFVTTSEYQEILDLDDEYLTYDAIAKETGADYWEVRAVLEDGEYRVLQEADPAELEG